MLAAAGLLMMVAVFWPRSSRRAASAVVCGAGFVAGFVFAILVDEKSPNGAAIVADSIFRDRWSATAQIIVAACGLVAVLVAYREPMREENIAEYYVLLAAAGAGMAFFVQAANLLTLFLGLEWFSVALYVMCAIDIDLIGSLEAGLKYLVVGAVGSATLLFGSALVYGATGELSFDKIAAAGNTHDSLLVLGLAMMIAGFAFKASAAPFHMWTPDAYQGAPTPVTAFMSSATKVAALVVTYRVLITAFPGEEHLWTWAIAAIAICSLAVGNIAALAQRNVKRLLAYSSVSHAGFMLIAIAAANETGARALVYYLIPYCAMSLGAFGVIAARERELGVPVTLDNLSGFGWERPFFGVAMWVFMLGLPRLPAHRRLLGEDLRLRGDLRARLVVADRDRRHRHGRLRRLLPGGRAVDVPSRQRRAAAGAGRRLAAARARARDGRGDRGRRHGRLVLRRAAARRRGAGRRERAPVLTRPGRHARALYGFAGESEPSRRQCGASANAALSANSATAASSDDTASGGTPWTALERTRAGEHEQRDDQAGAEGLQPGEARAGVDEVAEGDDRRHGGERERGEERVAGEAVGADRVGECRHRDEQDGQSPASHGW